MKPYLQIPIVDCGEPLVPIPLDQFAVEPIHPYIKLGADYQGKSPYFLRQGVLEALFQSQESLQQQRPGWKILIFDAYRPVVVQQYMANYTFAAAVKEKGLTAAQLSAAQRQAIWEQVCEFWAVPSLDPATPPPHSTGAAVDVTLVDGEGQAVEMGGEIDELSARSHPNYYANARTPAEQQYRTHRQILTAAMHSSGFRCHPGEWWHFCLGDQMWAWLNAQDNPTCRRVARYGRAFPT